MKTDLTERLFNFAVSSIRYLHHLPDTPEIKNIRYQLSKSCTSPGANYEEAQAGSSKADFIYKTEIALREMRKSNYWLRILDATLQLKDKDKDTLIYLLRESTELKKILATIIIRAKQAAKNK